MVYQLLCDCLLVALSHLIVEYSYILQYTDHKALPYPVVLQNGKALEIKITIIDETQIISNYFIYLTLLLDEE